MSKSRALLFAEAVTLAHVVRVYRIAKTLFEEGYDVHFAVAQRFRFVYDEPGIKLHWIASKSAQTFLDNVEMGKRLYRSEELIRYAYEELAVIDKVKPDWVLGDFRHSLSISARLRGIPYLNLINAYWSRAYAGHLLPVPELRQFPLSRVPLSRRLMPVLTPIIFKAQAQPLNDARRHFNLEPYEHCLQGWAGGDRTLFCDVAESFAAFAPAPHERFIGHVTWEPTDASRTTERWLEALDKDDYVYAALGSSGGQGIRNRVVDALIAAGYPVCVSGVADGDRPASWPSEVLSAEFVSGSAIARAARLVITNGGSPTTYQALNTGTPVIGIPANMDQVLCINHIQKLNAGRLVRPWQVGRPQFAKAVEELMSGMCAKEAATWSQWSQKTDFRTELRRTIEYLN
ncbi:hypothetical protein [Breoghania sp. JC706]|uniref:glycosyltransferase n=1 Tax=Breoghania sp. JC706 TaxID=3117732 RepID=UPI003009DB0B